jgi:hypothetical protein
MTERLEAGHAWDDSWVVGPPDKTDGYDPQELEAIPGYVPAEKLVRIVVDKPKEAEGWD